MIPSSQFHARFSLFILRDLSSFDSVACLLYEMTSSCGISGSTLSWLLTWPSHLTCDSFPVALDGSPSSASSLVPAPGYPHLVSGYPELHFCESTRHCHLRVHAVILSSSPPLHLANLYFRCKIRECFLWEPFLTLPGWVRFTSFVILSILYFCNHGLCHSCTDYAFIYVSSTQLQAL